MRILTLTNTFTPHVGGVARSVAAFTAEHRRCGHRVLVVAPEFEGAREREKGVLRVPAIQNFNGSDFSFPVPVPVRLRHVLSDFRPQVIHSNHPFLLGDTALRLGAERRLPVVFTHHTLYERYVHYVPGDSPRMQQAAIELAVGYCNLCEAVIAPSVSIAELLTDRGVTTPIEVIPTGVDLELYAHGDGSAARRRLGIPPQAFVVGHVGRLAPEKNLPLLTEAVREFLRRRTDACFLVAAAGEGPETLREEFRRQGLEDRLVVLGVLDPESLADTYHAMDAFAFASQTETQGMVLTEAMAARVPVVALDAPGVRDVVRDGVNGRLMDRPEAGALTEALTWLSEQPEERREDLREGAWATAEELSISRTAARTRELFRSLRPRRRPAVALEDSAWQRARRRLAEEWKIVRNLAHALGDLISEEEG